jgi:hypothetical protein
MVEFPHWGTPKPSSDMGCGEFYVERASDVVGCSVGSLVGWLVGWEEWSEERKARSDSAPEPHRTMSEQNGFAAVGGAIPILR